VIVDPAAIATLEYRDGALCALLVTEEPGVQREAFGDGPEGIWVWPVPVDVVRR
jgi:hypothetical protein